MSQLRRLTCVCFCVPTGNVLLMKKAPPLPPPHVTISSSQTQQQVASTGWWKLSSLCLLTQGRQLITIATSDLTVGRHMATDDVISPEWDDVITGIKWTDWSWWLKLFRVL